MSNSSPKDKLKDLFPYLVEEGESSIKGVRYLSFKFKDKPIDISVNYSCTCKDCSVNNHKWRCQYIKAIFLYLSMNPKDRPNHKRPLFLKELDKEKK